MTRLSVPSKGNGNGNGGGDGTDGTLHNEVLRQALRDLLAKGMTQTELAKKLGYSAGALSSYLSGNYNGNAAQFEDAIVKLLAVEKGRGAAMRRAPGFQVTPTAARLLDMLSYAQAYSAFVVGFGGAGLGKTVSAKEYRRTHSNVWIVPLSRSDSSISAVLEAVAKALGLGKLPSRTHHLHARILEELRGTGGLLIIDEAQHLTDAALEDVRRLYDESSDELGEPGVGLALLGNDSVFGRLGLKHKAQDMAQVRSRIGMRAKLERPSLGDVKVLLAAWGIEDPMTVMLARHLAAMPGALRIMSQTLRLAAHLAEGGEIREAPMRAAMEKLEITLPKGHGHADEV
jgi:DNA transposition AAA+ family ATPase